MHYRPSWWQVALFFCLLVELKPKTRVIPVPLLQDIHLQFVEHNYIDISFVPHAMSHTVSQASHA